MGGPQITYKLMSEELKERFGDIYVDTTFQDNRIRVGFLRRKADAAVLTYHEVHFDQRGVERMGQFHVKIVSGSLLGETIKASGIPHTRYDSALSINSIPEALSKYTNLEKCLSKTVTYTVDGEPYVRIEEYYNPQFTPVPSKEPVHN